MAHRTEKERDADRSRAAILDAAERLFAEQGYDATSLTQVGADAGVSRGTPGYFFRSKAELYQAVLDRSFAEVREAVREGRARALASNESRRDHPGRRGLRLLRFPGRPAQLRPPDRARGPERGPAARRA